MSTRHRCLLRERRRSHLGSRAAVAQRFCTRSGLRAHCAVQRRPTGRRYGSAPRDDAAGSLEEADHTRLHQLRLRRRTLCRLPARGWCGRRRGSHSLPRGHRRRSRKRARRFHRNAGGAQLRQAHRPGGRLDSEVLADAQSRGDEQVAATTTPPPQSRGRSRAAARGKSQRCSKSPNPPFRHGSRRCPRMSVEPDGLASSSSISHAIGGGMKFGTIGAGAVALAFGREALARGHEVVLSSRRGPDALVDKVVELGRGASAASVEEAASLDYVLLAVPWRNVESALKSLPAWNGRVLIDATNPFVETSPKLVLADLGGKGASEVVAALAPGARIVKAFNSIVTARFNEGPVKNGGRRVIFVSGDHPEPTAFIKQLIESFGFTAIDLGDLATGGRLQQAGGPLAGRDLVEFGHH